MEGEILCCPRSCGESLGKLGLGAGCFWLPVPCAAGLVSLPAIIRGGKSIVNRRESRHHPGDQQILCENRRVPIDLVIKGARPQRLNRITVLGKSSLGKGWGRTARLFWYLPADNAARPALLLQGAEGRTSPSDACPRV